MSARFELRVGGRLLRRVLLAASLAAACGGDPAPRASGPNLLLISLDTLRADHLGCYGYVRATSPAIDGLAAGAVLFEQARSQSNKTGPSHMSVLTGLLPDSHGVPNLDTSGNRRLSPHVPTLTTLLADQGYRTAAFHAGGHISDQLGFERGFQRFEGPGGVETNVSKTLEAIDGFEGAPFFVFLHTYEIHDPYTPPAGFADLFTDPEYQGRVTYTREGLASTAQGQWEQKHELFWLRVDRDSPADRQQLLDLYDGGIAYTDTEIRRLLDGLTERGLDRNTIVVLLSDHGEEFGDHGDFQHNAIWDEHLHVPLILRAPAAVAASVPPAGLVGVRVPDRVQLVDVLPTLLELMDLPVPAHVQGRSLLPLLRGQSMAQVDTYANWPRARMWALEHGGFKLIRREDEAGNAEQVLFDLVADRDERNDLSRSHPDLLADLQMRLLALRDVNRRYLESLAAGDAVVLDDETRKSLEALGYLGGGN